MSPYAKFILLAGVGHLLEGDELQQVRLKFDTEAMYNSFAGLAEEIENGTAQNMVEKIIESLALVFPEFVKPQT